MIFLSQLKFKTKEKMKVTIIVQKLPKEYIYKLFPDEEDVFLFLE
jgi:hypothetical protein